MSLRFTVPMRQALKDAGTACDNAQKTFETIPIKDRQIALFKIIKDLEQTCRLLHKSLDRLVYDNSRETPLDAAKYLGTPATPQK
jgi:hypothetical protein